MRLAVVLGATVSLLVMAGPANAAPARGPIPLSYTNSFAGYAAQGPITEISAQLTVPKVKCPAKAAESGVSVEVVSLVQHGKTSKESYGAIEVDCNGGVVTDNAAIVLNAGPVQEIKESTVTVKPGDTVAMAVKESLHGTSVTIHDLTTKTAKTETSPHGYKIVQVQVGDARLDDYINGQFAKALPLAPFTTNHFTHAALNRKRLGTAKEIVRFQWTANGKPKGRVDAMASPLATNNAFTVTFKHSS
jgi:hypothetical protein